jgi:hypothetical protein
MVSRAWAFALVGWVMPVPRGEAIADGSSRDVFVEATGADAERCRTDYHTTRRLRIPSVDRQRRSQSCLANAELSCGANSPSAVSHDTASRLAGAPS